MAIGSISTLGIGSGLELQSILDQLREVDQQAITTKENETTYFEAQLNEFTVVKNKMLTMKTDALALSLSSSFLGRSFSSSDESVFTATGVDGATIQTSSIIVDQLATKSSWLSAGVSTEDTIIYVPTSQESTTGVADPALTNIAASDGSMVITYGGSSTITLDVGPTGGIDTMDELVTAINTDIENAGTGANGRMVTASTYVVGTETFLRVETDTVGGAGESDRVAITTNDTDIAFAPPADVFQYQIGSAGDETVVTINVAADTTLNQLVSLINADVDNAGVTASVIDTGVGLNPFQLLLQADDTGEDNRITINDDLPDLAFAEEQGAAAASLNSQIEVDGISYERQNNAVSDIFNGVTLTLESSGSSTLSVANNTDIVKGLIVDLVKSYNEVAQEVATHTAYDEDTESFGILAGTTLRDLRYELEGVMTSNVTADSTGTVTSLFDLGLEFDREGTISIDTTVLDAALAASPESVGGFFLGDEDSDITGFADQVNAYLRVVTAGNGQIEGEKSVAQTRIDDLTLKIEADTERLDKRYEILTRRFIELDSYMSQMTTIANYLTGQFSSLSDGWGQVGGKN